MGAAKTASTADAVTHLQRATDDSAGYTDGRLASFNTSLSSIPASVESIKELFTAHAASPSDPGPLDKAAVEKALVGDAAIAKPLDRFVAHFSSHQ